jgi:hypothetical protein
MNFKEVLGIIASLIALVSYIPYFRDIFKGKTKPHAFSWLVWSILTFIAFFGQLAGGAGAGAWVNGVTAIICFIIFIFGIQKGRGTIVFIDWISLVGAFVAILFWFITKGPLLSIILVTLTDALGFFPTFRKSFINPHEETLSTYFLSGLKYIFALLALDNVSVVTALFPSYLIIANWIFVVMIVFRKKRLKR